MSADRCLGPKPRWLRALHRLPWLVQERFWHAFGGAMAWTCGFLGHRWHQSTTDIGRGLWHCDRWGCDYWLADSWDEPLRWTVV